MTIMSVYRCSCGDAPEAEVYRLCEDLMGAKAVCQGCGQEAEEVEHVWGGVEIKMMALEEWNDMRREQESKKAAD